MSSFRLKKGETVFTVFDEPFSDYHCKQSTNYLVKFFINIEKLRKYVDPRSKFDTKFFIN